MKTLNMNPTAACTKRSECFAEDLCHTPAAATRPGGLRTALLGSALLIAICLAGPARAGDIVSYVYAGVVDDDEAGRGWTSFTGQIAFYKFAVDLIPDPHTADYKISNSPSGNWPNGMNVTFNTGESVSFNNYFDILVTNNLGGTDQFGAQAHDAGAPDSLGITLFDFSQSVFNSDALPLPAGGLTLAPFNWTTFKYESAVGLLSGHLTGLMCVAGCEALPAVPEPQSWALLLAGLGTMGLLAHRRRSV
jgi:PEP-CTERM motif